MDHLADIRRDRAYRRLRLAVYDADKHATGEQHHHLVKIKQAVRAGEMNVEAAIAAVNHLRTQQHQRAA